MTKKLAKIKYLPNNFQIIENGDFVICAVSGKKINLEDLTYWNVDLQEPYFSYKEAFIKKITRENNNSFPSVMGPYPLLWLTYNHFFETFI